MPELPSGTVTFLFTDIEGSTRLLRELGDDYAGALGEHRRVLREAFARHGGVEVDTQGDAFFVAFARAKDALEAAAEGQRALDRGPVRVRMGLHTGEPVVTEEGYVGIDVHRAARIAAVGYGGQILVSQSTRELAGADGLRDLGEHRLKDLTAAERIFQLGESDFPPLKSLNATNLPVTTSSLVGREHELAELQTLFRNSVRLVTLTGAGGSGKTRLALQVAAELVDDFSGGVFFVPLAGLRQPELVESTIGATVGVRDLSELQDRKTLFVVDNFEHLLDAAKAVAHLLRTASQTRVLATSRAPLRLAGEHEYPVEPLPENDALELLTQRARSIRRDFEPDSAARQICRRLDGLPLALELVAPRLRSVGASAPLERLHRRLPLLTAGTRDAPERQRTLRATIEWSYDLHEPELRALLARLAVFAGTFSLEGAEGVARATLDDVDALVEASMLKALDSDRFLMLETIQEFATDLLEADTGADDVRLRHAEFFLEVAQRANLNVEAEGPMHHDFVVPERNNLRAALAWTLSTGRGELGLRLAVALENYWVTGDPEEGRRWIEALLAREDSVPADLHALAIRCLGNCTVLLGDAEGGIQLYEQSTSEFRALGDDLRVAIGLHRIAANALFLGEVDRARQLNEESLAFHRQVGFKKGEAQCLTLFGDLEARAGAPDRALDFYERSVALCRQTGFTWWEKNVLLSQALALFALGRTTEAMRCATDALVLADRMADRPGTVEALALVARGAIESGQERAAGVIWGGIEAEVQRAPVPSWEHERDELAGAMLARAGTIFGSGRSEGEALTLDQTVAAALELGRG